MAMSAPLRIKSIRSGEYVATTAIENEPAKADDYRSKLMKLIPGEVITVYLAGYVVLAPTDFGLHVFWGLVCLVGLVVDRVRNTSDLSLKQTPQYLAVVVSAIAFLIWIYASGGPFKAWDLNHPDLFQIHNQKLAVLLTVGYTFLVAPFLV